MRCESEAPHLVLDHSTTYITVLLAGGWREGRKSPPNGVDEPGIVLKIAMASLELIDLGEGWQR